MSSNDGSATGPTRVYIVDDHRAFVDAVGVVLRLAADMELAGSAPSVEVALSQLQASPADVVLMDLRLPGASGLEGLKTVKSRFPDTEVIILTGHANPEALVIAAENGAAGFLSKDAAMADVLSAVRGAASGGLVIDPESLAAVRDRFAVGELEDLADVKLTEREAEVLRLLAEGKTPKDIAVALGITTHTCRGYVKAILRKLRVHSQLEAVARAAKLGLIDI